MMMVRAPTSVPRCCARAHGDSDGDGDDDDYDSDLGPCCCARAPDGGDGSDDDDDNSDKNDLTYFSVLLWTSTR